MLDSGGVKRYAFFERASYYFMLVLYFECTLGSSGRWFDFGYISLRMILFAAAFIFSLPVVFRSIKLLIHDRIIISNMIFFLYVAFSCVLGFIYQNNPDFVRSDLTGFLFIVALPGLVCVFNTRKKIETLIKTIVIGSTILAVITLLLHYLSPLLNVGKIDDYLTSYDFGFMGILGQDIYRIFFRSSIFNGAAIFLLFYLFCFEDNKKKRLIYTAGIVLNSYAVLLCYTRAIWIGVFLSLIVFLIMARSYSKQILKAFIQVVIGFSLLLFTSFIIYGNFGVITQGIGRIYNSANVIPDTVAENENQDVEQSQSQVQAQNSQQSKSKPVESQPVQETQTENLKETAEKPTANQNTADEDKVGEILITDQETADKDKTKVDDMSGSENAQYKADILRVESLKLSFKLFAQKPVFGQGLGKNLDGLRNDGKTEFTYLDMLMKLGAVGMAIYVVPFILLAVQYFKQRKKRSEEGRLLADASVAALLLVLIVSMFNPFVTNPLGLSIYCLAILTIIKLKPDSSHGVN